MTGANLEKKLRPTKFWCRQESGFTCRGERNGLGWGGSEGEGLGRNSQKGRREKYELTNRDGDEIFNFLFLSSPCGSCILLQANSVQSF